MAASIVQSKAAAQNTGLATVAATWDTPAVAGNTLVIVMGGDDYAATPPTGFSESIGCKQETFLGHYVWWKVAAGGETSVNYTIGSASPSCWITAEISGLTSSPYDISNGQLTASSADNYTTPAVAPSSGERFALASIGGSSGSAYTGGEDTWLSSFVEIKDINTTLGAGTRDIIGLASRSITGDGVTTFSSGASYTGPSTSQSRTGIIIVFKVASTVVAGATYILLPVGPGRNSPSGLWAPWAGNIADGVTQNATASLTGTATLAAAAAVVHPIDGTLTGTDTGTAAVTLTAVVAGALTGTGTLTAAATRQAFGDVPFTATGTLTADAEIVNGPGGGAPLAVPPGRLAPQGVFWTFPTLLPDPPGQSAAASITVTDAGTAAVTLVATAAGVLLETATLTAAATRAADGAATLPGIGTGTATVALAIPVVSTLAAAATVTADASVTRAVGGTLTETATLTADAVTGTITTMSAALAGVATLDAWAEVVTRAQAHGWYSLIAILRDNYSRQSVEDQWDLQLFHDPQYPVADTRPAPAPYRSCPNDGELLLLAPDGGVYCPFDGWRPSVGEDVR